MARLDCDDSAAIVVLENGAQQPTLTTKQSMARREQLVAVRAQLAASSIWGRQAAKRGAHLQSALLGIAEPFIGRAFARPLAFPTRQRQFA
jgi:hypothetical protein